MVQKRLTLLWTRTRIDREVTLACDWMRCRLWKGVIAWLRVPSSLIRKMLIAGFECRISCIKNTPTVVRGVRQNVVCDGLKPQRDTTVVNRIILSRWGDGLRERRIKSQHCRKWAHSLSGMRSSFFRPSPEFRPDFCMLRWTPVAIFQ